MIEINLPFQFELIVSGIGSIGALLLAQPAAINAERNANNAELRNILIGIGLLYLFFLLPVWFKFYHYYGIRDFIIIMFISVFPIALFGIFGRNRRNFLISMSALIVVYLVIVVLMTLGIGMR